MPKLGPQNGGHYLEVFFSSGLTVFRKRTREVKEGERREKSKKE
jgi:hypothetical protein